MYFTVADEECYDEDFSRATETVKQSFNELYCFRNNAMEMNLTSSEFSDWYFNQNKVGRCLPHEALSVNLLDTLEENDIAEDLREELESMK